MNAGAHDFEGNERFQVRQQLGAGSFGVVYEALDRQHGIPVALKLLYRTEPGALYRFKQEFRLLTDLVHPNLVTLYELLSEGDRWFFTMELVEGYAFLDYLRQRASAEAAPGSPDDATAESPHSPKSGYADAHPSPVTPSSPDEPTFLSQRSAPPLTEPIVALPPPPVEPRAVLPVFSLDPERLRAAFYDLAQGVRALHAAGIVHRDLKPSNVRVSHSGRVVVLDFGLAKELLPPSPQGPGSPEPVAGSPGYMAPEQWTLQPVSFASDWYAVGVTLFEALVGGRPFDQTGPQAVAAQLRGPPPVHSLVQGAPDDLAALCHELLRPNPKDRPSGDEIVRRLAPSGTPRERHAPPVLDGAPLVGRERELAVLEESFKESQSQPVIAFISGKSGMGKTALMRSFMASLRERGAAVALSSRCYERESVPYKGLDNLLDTISRHLFQLPRAEARALVPEGIGALARLFPVLRLNTGLIPETPSEPPADPLLARAQAADALKELLRRLARRKPLVLSIDDLQWGDLDSARLLVEVLSPPDPPPLLLLVGHREDAVAGDGCVAELRQLWARVPWARPPKQLELGPLSPDEIAGLARERLGISTAEGRQRAEQIAREAAGSPLLAEELVRAAGEGGAMQAAGEGAELSLARVIGARVRQLPESVRGLLELVAVAGRPLEQGLAVEAARGGTSALSSIALLRAGHLLRTRVAGERVDLELTHDRLRESIVSALDRGTLAGHHRRLSEVIEASAQPDPEVLAVHLHGAGELGRAAVYAVRAAERANQVLAFARAAELYGLAIEWSRDAQVSGLPPRRELELARAEALALSGRSAEAAQLFLQVAADAAPEEWVDLQRRAIEHFMLGGRIEDGMRLLGPVLEKLRLSYPKSVPATLLRIVWMLVYLKLRGTRFRERPESEVPRPLLTRIDMCWALGKALADVDPLRGTDFQLRSTVLSLDAGEPRRVSRSLLAFGWMWLWQGTPGSVQTGTRLIEEGGAVARRVNRPELLGMVEVSASARAIVLGDWRVALERADAGLKIVQEQCSGALWEAKMARLLGMVVLEGTGRFRELTVRAAEWYRTATELGDLFSGITASLSWALAQVAANDVNGARERLREGLERWPRAGIIQHASAFRVELHGDLQEGKPEVAWERITKMWPAIQSAQLLRAQMSRLEMYGMRARAGIALAARGDGRREALLRTAEQDAARLERELRKDMGALGHLLRAGVARVRGQHEQALAHVSAAIEGYDAAGMAVHGAVARRRKGELVGGDEGRALIAAADARMMEEGIQEPRRWANVIGPGFEGAP